MQTLNCIVGVYLIPSKACGETPAAICACGEWPATRYQSMTSALYYQVVLFEYCNQDIKGLISICFLPHGLGMRLVSTSWHILSFVWNQKSTSNFFWWEPGNEAVLLTISKSDMQLQSVSHNCPMLHFVSASGTCSWSGCCGCPPPPTATDGVCVPREERIVTWEMERRAKKYHER